MSSSKFELMCYYIVCRQKANKDRLQKLRKFRSTEEYKDVYQDYNRFCTVSHLIKFKHKLKVINTKEIRAYRNAANSMRKVSLNVYSPLRRELKMKIKYDGSNNVSSIKYDGQTFDYAHVKAIAAGYEFDEVVLRDKASIKNPYKGE